MSAPSPAASPAFSWRSQRARVAPRYYIRGLGNSDFDLAASQPVSIIEDNVVEENVVLKSAPLTTSPDVEVDRGPQGTLFGAATRPPASSSFTTAKPSDTLRRL